jgi:ubiquinone/menaquinone biosynthesis C-methylase UbiE
MRRRSLIDLLQPAQDERILEIGPGIGYYSLDVAPRLSPNGQLDVLDLQQPMLDELRRRRAALLIDNITETLGDARRLPYPNAVFDAAYLVATLGEMPAKDEALRELHRVLKPAGRLVVGEGQPDPHMVPAFSLRSLAEGAGFRHDQTTGSSLGYFSRFIAK